MAEFTKFPTFHQVNSNQVALCRLGTGKVAKNRGARDEDAQYRIAGNFREHKFSRITNKHARKKISRFLFSR